MEDSEVGFRNQPFIPEVTNRRILDNLRAVQRRNGLRPSDELTGPGVNLSIEMETGTGKTYTYVKTMYELNKRYGWSKYIIVVPSVAIREGVYKSLQTTQEHFADEYGKKIRFFIYNSDRLTEVDRFASDSAINVMIINMQAFNSSKNQRIIDKKLDTFRSRKPIDIIAKTNPILIIDEPQSVEGKQTKESLKKFCPLFTLRYSATHKEKYDMVYRLDAMDAYLRRDPKEAQVGLRAETCRYEYAKANGNTALMLAALEKKETYYALVLARKEEVRVRDAGRYLRIGQRLHNTLESAASANRTKTRFLANMSHDIRTPINGILGMLEVIRDCRSDEARVDDCLGKIDISAKHLLSLVNDVLDMSKIESNSFVVEAKPFNLARTLVEVDDIVRFQAEQNGLRLYTDHDDVHDADLLGSALYLKKILVNLYSNAIKYNKPGGSITTRLREVSRTADTAVYAFTIRDTGIGMTQDFIDNHLFEAFSQEDNAARSQYGGTGLGMSIVSQLVQKMNGTITVESTVGEGSSFTVTLPFAIDHDPPAAGPEKEAPADLHGKRLLAVEDNELNMEIAEFMLKSAGAEVVKAFDGESAVRAFAADPAGCDAILMDLMMPAMDGYAAARAIRASGQPRAGTVPIIAMSANAYAEDVKKCLDSGMNAHISKPLFKDVMLRTIARFV